MGEVVNGQILRPVFSGINCPTYKRLLNVQLQTSADAVNSPIDKVGYSSVSVATHIIWFKRQQRRRATMSGVKEK
jgi:hypothetical protein